MAWGHHPQLIRMSIPISDESSSPEALRPRPLPVEECFTSPSHPHRHPVWEQECEMSGMNWVSKSSPGFPGPPPSTQQQEQGGRISRRCSEKDNSEKEVCFEPTGFLSVCCMQSLLFLFLEYSGFPPSLGFYLLFFH